MAARRVEVSASSSPGGAIAAAVPGVWREVRAAAERCALLRGYLSAAGASGARAAKPLIEGFRRTGHPKIEVRIIAAERDSGDRRQD